VNPHESTPYTRRPESPGRQQGSCSCLRYPAQGGCLLPDAHFGMQPCHRLQTEVLLRLQRTLPHSNATDDEHASPEGNENEQAQNIPTGPLLNHASLLQRPHVSSPSPQQTWPFRCWRGSEGSEHVDLTCCPIHTTRPTSFFSSSPPQQPIRSLGHRNLQVSYYSVQATPSTSLGIQGVSFLYAVYESLIC
jgi:hypothetical protein